MVVSELEDFEHAVTQVLDADLRDADHVAIRTSGELWKRLLELNQETDSGLAFQNERLKRRAPSWRFIVFPDGHELAMQQISVDSAKDLLPRILIDETGQKVLEPVSESVLADLRASDLELTIKGGWGRCVFLSSSNHHFVLPSGAHTSRFYRLCDALTDLRIIDRIAYWIGLDLWVSNDRQLSSNSCCLVVDHPSMLLVGTRIQSILSRTFELHAIQRYPVDAPSKRAIGELFASLWQKFESVHVIVGIASTGRFSRYLVELANSNDRSASVAVLYATQKLQGSKVLCELEVEAYRHYSSKETCELCKEGSSPVLVDGATYLVGRTLGAPVALPPIFFQQQRGLIEKYGRVSGVLRVHYDNPNETPPRHHAFYVDVQSLLEIQGFREEFRRLLTGLAPAPDLIVLPKHRGAMRAAQVANEITRIPCFVVNQPLGELTPAALKKHLRSSKTIAVLDDMMMSGDRLRQINRMFREQSEFFPMLQTIHFIALIALPDSDQSYNLATRGLITQHSSVKRNIVHLYKFPLPSWGTRDCPWCKERRILESLMGDLSGLESPFEERIAELALTGSGLTENCFLKTPGCEGIPRLGNSSAILSRESTPLQVLMTCASAVQQARTATSNALRADDFLAPQLLAVRVFEYNFDERMIWLALLRALRGVELEEALKAYLVKCAKEINLAHPHRFVMAEFALDWLAGSLGSIPRDGSVEKLFADAGFDWAQILKKGYAD